MACEFGKSLKERCRLSSNKHLSFKYFPKYEFVEVITKITRPFFYPYRHEWVKKMLMIFKDINITHKFTKIFSYILLAFLTDHAII